MPSTPRGETCYGRDVLANAQDQNVTTGPARISFNSKRHYYCFYVKQHVLVPVNAHRMRCLLVM